MRCLQSFDTNNSGAIELSEFTHWCLDIPTVAWRAERVRRTLNGNGDSVEHAAAVMADEALQVPVAPGRYDRTSNMANTRSKLIPQLVRCCQQLLILLS